MGSEMCIRDRPGALWTPGGFWLFAGLGLTVPYRALLERRCAVATLEVVKRVRSRRPELRSRRRPSCDDLLQPAASGATLRAVDVHPAVGVGVYDSTIRDRKNFLHRNVKKLHVLQIGVLLQPGLCPLSSQRTANQLRAPPKSPQTVQC